jgi:hypothetical protein
MRMQEIRWGTESVCLLQQRYKRSLIASWNESTMKSYSVQREWDYGAPGQTYECWTVGEDPESNTAYAYCSEGFGPKEPWGLVTLRGDYTGIGLDSGWFRTLADAFRNSFAWDGENPPDYEVS